MIATPRTIVQGLWIHHEKDEATKALIVADLEDLDCDVRFVDAKSPEAGVEQLRAGIQFGLIVCDLFFPGEPDDQEEPEGIEVVKRARERLASAVIVAITIGDQHRYPNLKETTLEAGADIFRYRVELRQGGFRPLAENIHRLLVEGQHVRDPVVMREDDPEDPGIQSLLLEVQRPTLRSLYRSAFNLNMRDAALFCASYVRPGASGAHLVMVETGIPPKWYLMKIDRSRGRLEKEVANARELAAHCRGGLVVEHLAASEVVQSGEWYAIVSKFQRRAVTLRAWLRTPEATAEMVAVVLSGVFLEEGLSSCYVDRGVETETVASAADRFRMPPYRQLRVERALDELEEVVGCPNGGNVESFSALRKGVRGFVRDCTVEDLQLRRVTVGSWSCFAHGDLHGGNILVGPGMRPAVWVIDASEYGVKHWASDPARLVVDVFSRVIDSGAEGAFWTHFDFWRAVAGAVGRLDVLPDPPPGTVGVKRDAGVDGGLRALNWLVSNLVSICPAIGTPKLLEARRWEWQLALVVEFFRGSYQGDVGIPKRAACLVAGYDGLGAVRDGVFG